MSGDHPAWRDVEAFYAEDERREDTIEHALPGVWYMENWEEEYRLFWLEQTGEIVAIAQRAVRQSSLLAENVVTGRRVELIAWTDSQRKAEAMLKGWTGQSGKLRSYYWLRRRADSAETPVVAGWQVREEHRGRAQTASGKLF